MSTNSNDLGTLIERIENFINDTPLKLGWRIAEAVEAHNSAIVDREYVEWLHVRAFLRDVLDKISESAALPPAPPQDYRADELCSQCGVVRPCYAHDSDKPRLTFAGRSGEMTSPVVADGGLDTASGNSLARQIRDTEQAYIEWAASPPAQAQESNDRIRALIEEVQDNHSYKCRSGKLADDPAWCELKRKLLVPPAPPRHDEQDLEARRRICDEILALFSKDSPPAQKD